MVEIKMCPGGTPMAQSEYNAGYMDMIEDFFVQASPELRTEIQTRIAKAVGVHCRSQGWAKPYVDWSHSVYLGELYHGWGPYYLYVWLNSEGIPFYAGQAKDERRVEHFTSTTRSEKFKEVVRKGGCHAVVVATGIPGSKINDLERGLIAYLKWKDYPVVNDKDLPSPMECSMAKKIAKAGKFTLEEVFLSNTKYESDFVKIFAVLNEVVGVEWTGECAIFPDIKRKLDKSCRA